MKVVILAGGFGTRISEESHLKPKPMIEIGDQPILWHIMKLYSYYGFHDFIICAGYKQHIIKEYFYNYALHRSDFTFNLRENNQMQVHSNVSEPWSVTIVDTGLNTMTGGRIKRVKDYIGHEPFLLTYGDGVADVNIKELVEYHKQKGHIATLTAVQPGGRFVVLDIASNNQIEFFREKNKDDGGWINGGFMVLEPEIFKYIKDDTTVFEKEPLETVAKMGELDAFMHSGFWQCMDTLRDKNYLEDLLEKHQAPWKVWDKK